MALHLDPPDHTGSNTRRVREGVAADQRLVVRDGVQTLGHGALACPSCALPLCPPTRLPAGQEINCAWCGHADRARRFVAQDVRDAPANEVVLTARLRDRRDRREGGPIRVLRRTAANR